MMPSGIADIQLRKSTFPSHSGGLTIGPSMALFDVLFISTMALKALEEPHLLTASSPTLESRPL
jgi:hypothetical protein